MDSTQFKRALSGLMDKYVQRYRKIEQERIEAKKEDDVQGELTCEAMKRQISKMIAELYIVQKELGFIEEED